jgi:LuxR family maltose regulon positive regulatory protein
MSRHSYNESQSPNLYIETLGQFTLYSDGVPLGDDIWKRKKARMLFQYLITSRTGFTARERIFDDLWPELDLARADRDFKVALNALNSALDPARSSREISHYIQRQGSSYGIKQTAPMVIDVDRFERLLLAGSKGESTSPEQAISDYRHGLELYKGEYLPDRIYDDWSSSERERLTSLFLLSATRLSSLLLAEGQTVELINWCHRVIDIDPLWEEAYRLQMMAHLSTGNRPLVIQIYKLCQEILESELGVPPMEETTRLYDLAVSP